MRSQHSKVASVFPSNNVRRRDVCAVIEIAVSVNCGKPCFVADFVRTGEFMGLTATREQYSHVARQMADDGLLWQSSVGGDYCYLWWADSGIEADASAAV